MEKVTVEFELRDEPLEPLVVIGVGPCARALASRVLEETDERLRGWTGLGAPALFAVLGASDTLPWVDGIIYLGRDSRAPRILIPTNLQPALVSIEVLERAVIGLTETLTPRLDAPIAILSDPRRIVSLSEARPIRRKSVVAWLEAMA